MISLYVSSTLRDADRTRLQGPQAGGRAMGRGGGSTSTSRAGDSMVAPILLCALAACATPRHWTRANTTEAEFHRDSFECAKESPGFKFRAWPKMTAGGGSTVDKDIYRSCMRARGYEFVEGRPWIGHRD